MAESVQGGRLVAQALAAHGVDTIFTLSGGHVMPVYEGCRLEGIRVLDVRHEQAAGHAAEAWGRVRRTAGVALVTAGPGVTGVVTPVANSFAAQTPLVVLGGARPLVQAEQGALQELDQLSLLKPITKWAAVCTQTERIPDFVATAFRHALAQPRGPVYLELPMDVLFAEAAPGRAAGAVPLGGAHVRRSTRAAEGGRPARFGRAAGGDRRERDLVGRRPPATQCVPRERAPAGLPPGLGARRDPAGARAAVPARARARRSRRPTSSACSGRRSIFAFASAGSRGSSCTSTPTRASSAATARPTPAIVGDTAAVLGIFADAVKDPRGDREGWLARLREAEQVWWDEHRGEIESDSAPLHHYRLAAELDRVLDPGTFVIGDGGDVVAACSRVLRVHRPGHWLDPGPFGCLGIGPPYALGVKAVHPDAQVVVIAGDGAFGLNGFELDTLVRFGLPAVFVIGNDAGWGEIRIPQRGIYGDEGEVATALAPSRYDLLTEALGGHGEHVERPDELAPALERALSSGQPAVVNVMLDPNAMAGHAYRGM